MRRSLVLVLVMVGGCRQLLGFDTPAHAPGIDAAPDGHDGVIDAPPDVSPGCYGEGLWTVCGTSTGLNVPINGAFNTDTDSICATAQPPPWTSNGQPNACFVVADTITINMGASFTGSRPIVLFATGAIDITATLDVASHAGTTAGAGSDPGTCPVSMLVGATNNNGGGGGAGGTFGTRGGSGGAGAGGGAAGGIAPPGLGTVPARLRGGCQGGAGGGGGGGIGGEGGHGGGAIYLVAGGSISITGVIDASGAGGLGGNASKGGGGGGGSGGYIVLWAPSISGNAQIYANGGGGAGGADNANNGLDGGDPTSPTMPAQGGSGGGNAGGIGANGAFGVGDGGTAGAAAAGAGGGGGGGGIIHVVSGQTLTGSISPPQS